MEYKLDDRVACRNFWIVQGDISRRRLEGAIPNLSGEHDLPEAQTAVGDGNMTRVMVPFQIDLCGCECVTGIVADVHLQHIIFNDKRPMRYAGYSAATN